MVKPQSMANIYNFISNHSVNSSELQLNFHLLIWNFVLSLTFEVFVIDSVTELINPMVDHVSWSDHGQAWNCKFYEQAQFSQL